MLFKDKLTKRVRWECRKCGDTDSTELFESETAADIIPCGKCRSGRGRTVAQNQKDGTGMWRLSEPAEVVH